MPKARSQWPFDRRAARALKQGVEPLGVVIDLHIRVGPRPYIVQAGPGRIVQAFLQILPGGRGWANKSFRQQLKLTEQSKKQHSFNFFSFKISAKRMGLRRPPRQSVGS